MPFISGPSGSDGINIDESSCSVNSVNAVTTESRIPSGVPIECENTLYEVGNGSLNLTYRSTHIYPKTICVLENGLIILQDSTYLRVLKYANNGLQLIRSSSLPTNLQDGSTYGEGIDIHPLSGDKAIILAVRKPNVTAAVVSVTESSVTFGTVYTYNANISSMSLHSTKLNNASILLACTFSSSVVGVSVLSINNTAISFSTPINTEFTYLYNIERLSNKYAVLINTTYAILLTISNNSVSASSQLYYIVSDYTSFSGTYGPFVTNEKLYLFMTPSGNYNAIVGLYCSNGTLKSTDTYLYPTANSEPWYPNGEYSSNIDTWSQYGIYKITDNTILITYYNISNKKIRETTFRYGLWKQSTGGTDMMIPHSVNEYASAYEYRSYIMINHDTMVCFDYSGSSPTTYRIIKIRPTVRRAGYRVDGISTSDITTNGGTCVLL